MVYAYIIGVYATYRHVLWREKNISPLLKSKQNGIVDESQGNDTE